MGHTFLWPDAQCDVWQARISRFLKPQNSHSVSVQLIDSWKNIQVLRPLVVKPGGGCRNGRGVYNPKPLLYPQILKSI
jgi:hypothetical protein